MDELDKSYTIPLGDMNRIVVRIRKGFTHRPSYAITLQCRFHEFDKWHEVLRGDDWHGRPHFDIASPNGTVKKRWLRDTGDNIANLEVAKEWILQNWYLQRERYETELKQRAGE